jgi:hypothetical protein
LFLPKELFPQAHVVDVRVLEAFMLRPQMALKAFSRSSLNFFQGRSSVDQLPIQEDGNQDLFSFEMGGIRFVNVG